MVKLKTIESPSSWGLERDVNEWLEKHRSLDIISIQYMTTGEHNRYLVACITYCDGG